MELLNNLLGTAVHGATYVDGARITGGPVWPAMDRAVGPRCQTQLTHAVLQTAFQRGLLLVPPIGDEEGARHPHLHGIEAAPACFVRVFENSDRLPNILWSRILPEQQIVALCGHLTD